MNRSRAGGTCIKRSLTALLPAAHGITNKIVVRRHNGTNIECAEPGVKTICPDETTIIFC